MTMRRPWVAVALTLSLAACGDRGRPSRRARAAAAAVAGNPSIDPATVPGQVALELWQLRDSVSLAEWNAMQPEPVARHTAGSDHEDLGGWCAVSERRTQVAGRAISRQAFFYPPAPPPALDPPDPSNPERLIARQCTLALIRVRIAVPDSATGVALAESLRTQLTRIGGPEIAGPNPGADSLLWSRGRWRRGKVTIGSGYRRPGSGDDPAAPGGEVLALAYLPNAELAPATNRAVRRADGLAAALAEALPLDSAVKLSAVDTALWTPLRRALPPPDGTGDTSFSADGRARVAEAFRRWLAAAAAQPASRRAAAVFVADQVLARIWDLVLCDNVRCRGMDSTRLRPWRAMGATFTHLATVDGWSYTHGWLAGILGLGLDGPVSNAAFLIMMARGFDPSSRCPVGAQPFRTVIAKGEAWLARHPQHPNGRAVHFLVADAYRDIVALGHGAVSGLADSTRYLEEVPASLAKALEHYRLAITPADTSVVAREAWRRAWWLSAGLPPRETRFVCE
jgi:hypothetical protein